MDDIIWVHDYHLIPLGVRVARAAAGRTDGFFPHIPLPQQVLAIPQHDWCAPCLPMT
jgi:trehalose 6-phosphate synthase